MSGGTLIALALLIPLAGAGLIALSGRRPNLREAVTIVTAVLLFAVNLLLAIEVTGGETPALRVVEPVEGVPIAFAIEPLGMLFGLVASFLWIVTSFYSIGYMRANGEPRQTRFYACFALALGATMAVAFSGNLLTTFIGYEALTLTTYPLVTHHSDAKSVRAGRTYLGILLGTSIALLLPGIVATWMLAGTLDFRAGGILSGTASDGVVLLLLGLYMFGIGKAALMPIHRWLPAAMVAPTPVSALLHAVAVVKAGVFVALKVIVYVFGIDLLNSSGAGAWLVWIATITLVLASVVALTKDNLKARLAYSTVSQLAYVVLAGALATQWGILGGGMHIAMHAFGKITLFFCAGAIYTALHKTEVSEMGGIGRAMPVTMLAFLIGALSVAGLPPGGGTWSKWYIALAAAETGHLIIVGALMLSTLLNIAYFMPIVARAWFVPRAIHPGRPARSAGAMAAPDGGEGLKEAPLFCLIPLSLTALGCVALFVFAGELQAFLAPMIDGLSTKGR